MELADELGVSDHAVNERMRRDTAKPVPSSPTAGTDPDRTGLILPVRKPSSVDPVGASAVFGFSMVLSAPSARDSRRSSGV